MSEAAFSAPPAHHTEGARVSGGCRYGAATDWRAVPLQHPCALLMSCCWLAGTYRPQRRRTGVNLLLPHTRGCQPPTAAKGVRLVAAVAADEPAHVLNNAQDGHVHLWMERND